MCVCLSVVVTKFVVCVFDCGSYEVCCVCVCVGGWVYTQITYSGWVVEPRIIHGKTYSRVTYLLQVRTLLNLS